MCEPGLWSVSRCSSLHICIKAYRNFCIKDYRNRNCLVTQYINSKKRKNVGRDDFSDQFRKIIVRYKRTGYNINIMRQSACLVFNRITVNNFASLFNRHRWVRCQTHRWPGHQTIYFSWLGSELFCLLLGPPGFNCWFSFAPVFQWCCSTPQGSPGVGRNTFFLSSPHLCFIIVFICDLFVSRDDP